MTVSEFQKKVWEYYRKHKRSMPWRTNPHPYYVFVSEIMLQQTQVDRVMKMFPKFIRAFPSLRALARGTRAQVLLAWQGLGYNRRALYAHKTAQILVKKYKGIIPADTTLLETLPGIGKNTAASICAFAFDKPVVFIETNIRTVFLFHFFRSKKNVSDDEILKLVKKTLPLKNIREWYWALMDYGSYIKKEYGNQNKRSKQYNKQTPFEGSRRQLRGKIIQLLLNNGSCDIQTISQSIGKKIEETELICSQLMTEGIICYNRKKKKYGI